MSADEGVRPEEEFADLLAACDEALASGRRRPGRGRRLATASAAGTVRAWSAVEGER